MRDVHQEFEFWLSKNDLEKDEVVETSYEKALALVDELGNLEALVASSVCVFVCMYVYIYVCVYVCKWINVSMCYRLLLFYCLYPFSLYYQGEDPLVAYQTYILFEREQHSNPVRVQLAYERAVESAALNADIWLSYCKYVVFTGPAFLHFNSSLSSSCSSCSCS